MRRAAALLLCLCLSARGADEIAGPAVVPLHSLATVSTAVPGDSFIWIISPTATSFPAHQADPRVLQFAGHPGPHEVTLIPLVGGKQAGQYHFVVTFGGGDVLPPPDPPIPTPDPTPGPQPVPPSEKVWATLVYDQAVPDPAIAVILTSPAVRQAAASLNMGWRAYDDDAQAVADRNLGPVVAAAGGPPVLILQSSDGRVLESVRCPPTPEGVAARFLGVRAMWGH